MVRRKSQQLWTAIESIEKSKDVTRGIGKKYFVHLVNGTKPVWVLGKNLSGGVSACYDASKTIPKKAKARVDRGYIKRKNKTNVAVKQSPEDPVKLAKRNMRWIITAGTWIAEINRVIFLCMKVGLPVLMIYVAGFED